MYPNVDIIGNCGPNTGCGPYAGPYGGLGYVPYTNAALAPYQYYGGPMTIIGQNGEGAGAGTQADPNKPSAMDSARSWLNEPTLGVKRGYLLAGALGAGLLFWGWRTQGWFGGKKSR